MVSRREYGSGGIEWVTNYKIRLSVRVEVKDGRKRRTKIVNVIHRDRGGRGVAVKELERFIEELKAEEGLGEADGATVAQLLEDYIAHCGRIGRSRGTVEGYETAAKRLTPELAAVPVASLTSRHLDDFYGVLAKRLAPNTIRTTHATISAALEQAIKWGLRPNNPASDATPPGKRKGNSKPLPIPDVARLAFAAAKPNEHHPNGDPVLAMAILMAALCGARRGELCGLQWDDLDIENCSIRLERQWVAGRGGQYLKDLDMKSENGVRTVYLASDGLALIEQYRAIMRELLNREPDGWLLSHDAGTTPLRAKSLGDAISRVGDNIGIKVSTHSFRKVSATQLIAAGVDVDTAARRMGHTKEVMLGDYVLGSDDKSIAAAQTIETRLIDQGLPIAQIMRAVMRDKDVEAAWSPKGGRRKKPSQPKG